MRQKGFTLVELLVAMALGGVILTGVLTTIYQVVFGTSRNNSQITALTNVDSASLWIKKDLQMPQSTNLTDGDPVPQSSIDLRWVDCTGWADADNCTHRCSYVLSGTDLLRTYDGTVSIVGRHITSLGFTENSRVINVIITATTPDTPSRSKTLNFSVCPRAEEATW